MPQSIQALQKVIQFHFPAVRSKLQNLFPFDPKADIQIQYKTNKYQLQIAYLRLQSTYFKTINNNLIKSIKIQQQFNDDLFQKIMKCFYGGTFTILLNKNQNSFINIIQIWKIISFMKIQHFKKKIINALKTNWNCVNFFQLVVFGYMNNIQQIFNTCLSILDNENYEQLKDHGSQFIKCPLQVLKFLLNLHNRRPILKRSLKYIQIHNLLQQYCQYHQYTYEFYKQLKFELIQKTQLNSEQYKIIFIDQNKNYQTLSTINKNSNSNIHSNIIQSNQQSNLINNQFNQLALNTKESFYNSHINYNLNHNNQKQHWSTNLLQLKSSLENQTAQSNIFTKSVHHLSIKITKKSQETQLNRSTLIKMEILLREIQKQIQQKGQILSRISQRVKRLENTSTIKNSKNKNKKQIEIEQQQQQDLFVQSHIIPGFVIGDIIAQNNNHNQINFNQIQHNLQHNTKQHNNNNNIKTKKQQKNDSTDYSYKNSLAFDQEPTSIPKRYLSYLSKFLDTDQFVKKKTLNLVYRRSKNSNSNIGTNQSIKKRNAILILIQTNSKKYAGGYISIQLPSSASSKSIPSQQNLCDYQSFLFSLTHNVKLPIRKGEQKSAICLSKHYLISFGNDLMISQECLNQDSYCQWPSLYQIKTSSKCQTAKQLVGGSQFKIDSIQIYEVKNQDIQMVL